MNIGGSSFNNGINFTSDKCTVKFTINKDGSYNISDSKRLPIQGIRKTAGKIPLVKGIFFLFGNRITTAIVLLVLAMDFVLPQTAHSSTAMLIINIMLLLYMIKNFFYNIKNTWTFHGAEHKAIYAREHSLPLTLESVRACPRVARRCGTNLAVFALFFCIPLYFVIDYPSLVLLLTFSLAYELFDMKNGDKLPILKWFSNWATGASSICLRRSPQICR